MLHVEPRIREHGPQLFLTTEKKKKKKRIHRAAQVCRMYESHKHAMPSFGLSTIQYILAPMVAELGSGGVRGLGPYRSRHL